MDRVNDIVLVKCGHRICPLCAKTMKHNSDKEQTRFNCPICRKPVEFYMKTYF